MDITQISKKFTNKNGLKIVTNYKDAVNWGNNDYVLCNNIVEIDSESIYGNMRFDNWGEGGDPINEIYQWFLTSASEWEVEYLEERFGLLFTYSDKLDCFILCVDHYGTSWDYVYCDDKEKDEHWQEQLKAAKANESEG